jgi:N-carbamoyl-L-amino-acid hydrolase
MNTQFIPSEVFETSAPLINSDRLWQSLMDLAQLGATVKGGVCRLALTDLDRQARDLFVKWCEAAYCTVTVDAIGDIFARRPGRDPLRAPATTRFSSLNWALRG